MLGFGKASLLSAFLIGILCLVLPIPYIFKVLSLKYMIIILIFVYPLLIYCMIKLIKKTPVHELAVLSRL